MRMIHPDPTKVMTYREYLGERYITESVVFC